jgi:hypothetical protein
MRLAVRPLQARSTAREMLQNQSNPGLTDRQLDLLDRRTLEISICPALNTQEGNKK